MAREKQYLNIYQGTDAVNNASTVVAEDMVTAATIYFQENGADPIILQRTKKHVLCALPDIYVTFKAEAYNQTTSQIDNACTVTPSTFTVVGGIKQIFTATAGDGYEFVKWQIDGADVTDEDGELVKSNVAQLTIPTSGATATVRAVFKLVD